MTQYAMVIDLHKCVSCGACALACKSENNTAIRKNGQTHNYCDFIYKTEGSFPNLSHSTTPVMCNHCSNAPCVEACPVEPKAMFKTPDGITMHSNERCIGCRACQEACPYSLDEVVDDNSYSVISYNEEDEPYQPFYRDPTEVIPGCTSSGIDTARAIGTTPPDRTMYDHPDYEDVRRSNIVEKCYFCEHRVKNGQLPYCVESCTARARRFGDISNPKSEVSKLLKKYENFVLKPKEGTKPNVYYIRKYSVKA
jgi:Fe-S-cluster-containing dehydrogenase component